MSSRVLKAFNNILAMLTAFRGRIDAVELNFTLLHFYGFFKKNSLTQRIQNPYLQRRYLVMDYIFDCFYEETFEQISRSGLQDRQSRRNVLDHLNAIIKGCSEGQNTHTEEVARIAVLSAIGYHRIKKTGNCEVCLMGKFHNILYIALRTCWDWGVRDSATVVDLLVEIYKCEKTFERIFLGALFGTNAPHFIAGWRSDFRDQNENIRAVVYFLKHATSQSLTLPVWIPRHEQERMVKFIDIPIESCGWSSPLRIALQACCPELLLILLRYGAEPNPPDGGSSVITALLDKISENGPYYVYENVLCLQMILRNVPMIEMPCKPIIYSVRREMFFERYGRLLIDKIITKEQVYGIVSLRHLCRCRIRDILRANGQLPDGIGMLRLPNRLQRYIDLTEEMDAVSKSTGSTVEQKSSLSQRKEREEQKMSVEMKRFDTIDSANSSRSSSESGEIEQPTVETHASHKAGDIENSPEAGQDVAVAVKMC